MSCYGSVLETEADAGGCLLDIFRDVVLALFMRSAIGQIPILSYLGPLFLKAWNLFNFGSFSVRTSGLNATPVGK